MRLYTCLQRNVKNPVGLREPWFYFINLKKKGITKRIIREFSIQMSQWQNRANTAILLAYHHPRFLCLHRSCPSLPLISLKAIFLSVSHFSRIFTVICSTRSQEGGIREPAKASAPLLLLFQNKIKSINSEHALITLLINSPPNQPHYLKS